MPTPVSNLQPTLTLAEYVEIQGIFPPRGGGGPGPYLGQIDISAAQPFLFGAPAQGQILAITQNTALFSLLGTFYGGNGTSNFELPNLAGVNAIGFGSGPGLDNFSLGQTTGTTANTLTAANLPSSLGGSSAPVVNYQPSLAINYVINVDGVFPTSSLTPDSIGVVSAFLGNFAPGGELFCQGQLLPIDQYTALFDLIGTTYGGDGQTTFALPDLRGRDIVGSGTSAFGSYVPGEQVGTANDVLTTSNLPSSGAPINNVQPGLVLNYYMATVGFFPSQPVNGAADPTEPYLGQIFAAAETLNSPNGAILCDGRLLPINQNQALFSLLGTTYGGNGITNFAIPDLRGRSILGVGGSNVEGQVDGAATTTLTNANFTPPSLGALAQTTVDPTAGGAGVAVLASAPTGLLATQTNGLLATVNVTITSPIAGDLLGVGTNFSLSTTATKITTGDGGDFLVTFTGATSTLAIANDLNVHNTIAQFETLLGQVAFRTGSLSASQTSRNLLWTANDGIQNSSPVMTSLTIDLIVLGTNGPDTLNGGAGNDRLDGLAGADVMSGGAGNDYYFVDNAGDKVNEAIGGGTDSVYATVSWSMASGQEIEFLSAYGVGLTSGVTLTGNEFNNTLRGGSGHDVLDGGAGKDTLTGLGGNDYYFVDNAGDKVNEAIGGGTDSVYATVSWSMASGQEIEFLSAYGVGLTPGVTLTGNEFNNTLRGGSGHDVLDGGAGKDTLTGLGGNDYYFVDNAGDKVNEAIGGGTDSVYATVSWSMASGQEIEFLSAYGVGLTSGVTLTGNEFNNTLRGGSGHDVLDGGAGKDTLTGLGGNDYYFVDNAGDKVNEAIGGGTDSVYATVSWSMASGQEIEFLSAYGVGLTSGVTLTGNEFNNTLRGGSGHDVLDGGAGKDTLTGLGGNDYYFVDNAGDKVNEAIGGGTDSVYATVSWSMASGQEIEFLSAYGAGLTSGVTLTGNEFNNTLRGGSGNDVLDGGAGNDTLTGLGGQDTFVFDSALIGNVDTVADFSAPNDTIQLDRSIFTAITTLGTLSAAAFFTGAAAHDTDDRIIYNSATGNLFYDSDGTGATAAVQFAHLNGAPVIGNTNFTVVA